MRAVVMRKNKLVVDNVPVPTPGPGEVLVKTLACGICGTDLHALRFAETLGGGLARSGGLYGMDPNRDVVLGHEFCAEVVDYGPGTRKRFKPGTRVCSIPVLKRTKEGASIGYSNEHPGGFGEMMRLSENLLVGVPDDLPSEVAALTEPMAVGYHAVAKARLERCDVSLVIGCGPVGLSVIAALKLKGTTPIVAADLSPRRRQLAVEMGADMVIDPREKSPYEPVMAAEWPRLGSVITNLGSFLASDFPIKSDMKYLIKSFYRAFGSGRFAGRPAVIFECAGVPGVIDGIMFNAPRNARIVVAGLCMERDHIYPWFGINKQLSLQFVQGYSDEEFATTLRNIRKGKLRVQPLITGKVGIEGVAKAFEELRSPEHHAKILVEPWRN
ncbi:MAG: zinc-binding dehydrogenase [Acidobacteriia bacterium]|nr:zinc-binding dehydrogenase [Terriglobia bacterium]